MQFEYLKSSVVLGYTTYHCASPNTNYYMSKCNKCSLGVELRTASRSILALVLAVIVCLSTWAFVQHNSDNGSDNGEELVWFTQVGDTLSFQISYSYSYYPGMGVYSIPDDVKIWLQSLHGLTVVATIVSLPEISQPMDKDKFTNEIVAQLKTSTRLVNGSAIPSESESTINSLISNAILPIKNWKMVESFYGSPAWSYPLNTIEWNYIGVEDYDHFLIGRRGQGYHGGEGWTAHVNLTTGLPIVITESAGYAWGDGSSYGYTLRLWSIDVL
jgi:hypothetical protein